LPGSRKENRKQEQETGNKKQETGKRQETPVSKSGFIDTLPSEAQCEP
jgi:hypothetical protein